MRACILLGTLLCLCAAASCMRISGSVHSETDGTAEDVYLGSFVFDKKGGKVKVEAHSGVAGQRMLFFDETETNWNEILATYNQLTCEELRRISLVITEDADDGSVAEGLALQVGEYTAEVAVAQTDRARRWYIMISNCDGGVDAQYNIDLINPGGWWSEQFSVEEQGVLQVYCLLLVVYTAGCAVYARQFLQLRSAGSIHPMVMLFTGTLVTEYIAVVFIVVHGVHYASDGYGLPVIQAFGEVLEWVSNILLAAVLILMAKGWTVVVNRLHLSKQWMAGAACLAVGMFLMLVLERALRDADTRSVYSTGAGLFTLFVRIGAGVYFTIQVRALLRDDTSSSPVRSQFLKAFAAGGCIWFFTLPIVAFFSVFGPPHSQPSTLVMTSSLLHMLGFLGIGFMLWPHAGGSYVKLGGGEGTGSSPYDEF